MLVGVGTTSFLITGVLVAVLIVGRVLIRRYGKGIGADEMDFDYRSEIRRERSVYSLLRTVYMVSAFIVGAWIMALGLRLVLGVAYELATTQPSSAELVTLQWAGALGAVCEFAGVGVLVMSVALRWERPPTEIKPASGGAQPMRPADMSTTSDVATDGTETALAQVIGPRSEKHPISRMYNLRPWILWGMVLFAILLVLCYLLVFVVQLTPQL